MATAASAAFCAAESPRMAANESFRVDRVLRDVARELAAKGCIMSQTRPLLAHIRPVLATGRSVRQAPFACADHLVGDACRFGGTADRPLPQQIKRYAGRAPRDGVFQRRRAATPSTVATARWSRTTRTFCPASNFPHLPLPMGFAAETRATALSRASRNCWQVAWVGDSPERPTHSQSVIVARMGAARCWCSETPLR